MHPDRIALMPDWPARMGEDMAALFMGVGQTSFRAKVAARIYPQPVIEGGRKLWSRRQLERFVDAQFNLPQAPDNDEGDGTWDDLR